MSPSHMFIFTQRLAGLSFNSKPLINALTEDASVLRATNAKRVVTEIENKIYSAHYTEKLPVLYLIDSIVKNVGGEYVQLFTKNLENTFCDAFEHPSNDLSTRISYARLLKTWPTVFPLSVVVSIQERIAKCMFNMMPHIMQDYSQQRQIHINPAFFEAITLPAPPSSNISSLSVASDYNPNFSFPENTSSVISSAPLHTPSCKTYSIPSTADPQFFYHNYVNTTSPKSLLEELYSSSLIQCNSCGIRLSSRDKMSQHLDDHFRFTNMEKNQAISRCWLPHCESWIANDTHSVFDSVAPAMQSMQSIRTGPKSQGITLTQSSDVIAEEDQDICPICQEQLDVYWNEEEQEWYFRDSIKQGQFAVHISCSTIVTNS